MHKLLKKIASDDFKFLYFITEPEKETVKAGFESFKDFFRKNKQKAIDERAEGKTGLWRLLTETVDYLKYIGDPRNLNVLESLRDFWNENNYEKIGAALQVRIDEASYEEPEITEEVELKEDDYNLFDEEEAPETQRSLVASIGRYINTFVKYIKS